MRAKNKLVAGVGINDILDLTYVDGRCCRAYQTWRNMLLRCYDARVQAKQPAYIGCVVDLKWHKLSAFRDWYDARYRPGFALDKDILVPGNKVYGPDRCVLVPRRINNLLLDHASARGDLPLGVTYSCGRYMAQCSNGTGTQIKVRFRTVDEAVAWYKATKARVIRRTATDALVRREINIRVHAALLRRARELRQSTIVPSLSTR